MGHRLLGSDVDEFLAGLSPERTARGRQDEPADFVGSAATQRLGEGGMLRVDRDDLTRADLATRATTINSLIASQTINPNEGRSWLGLPPREGGDEFLNPNISAAPSAPEPEDPNATE